MLKSDRLSFQIFGEDAFESYFRLVGNQKVMSLITGKPLSEQQAKEKYAKIQEINKQHAPLGYYMVKHTDSDAFIGLGKLVMISHEEAETGYMLLPDYWGKGYGSEICGALIRFAGQFDFIEKIIAIIDPENAASKKILLQYGFHLVEVFEYENLPAEMYGLLNR